MKNKTTNYYKIICADGRSLNGKHQYDLAGGWQDVPGNGAYVSHNGAGVFGSKSIDEGDILVRLDVTEFSDIPCKIDGVACYRRVRIVQVVAWDSAEAAAVCRAAVTQDGAVLYYVPEALRTSELCLAAVTQSGWALQYVPAALLTPALCRAAVTQDGAALEHVPADIVATVETVRRRKNEK